MKLLTLGLVICLFPVAASQAIGQETRLHLTRFFPDSSPGRVVLTASSAQRDVSASGATIVHLRGNVEVRVITCGPESEVAHLRDSRQRRGSRTKASIRHFFTTADFSCRAA